MQGAKRGRQEGGGGRPNKRKYLNKAPPSGKSGVPLPSRGILISCTSSKEHQAGHEAAALFTEAYEALGGTWKQQGSGAKASGEGGADAPTDFAAALASEVAELRDTSRQPFYFHQVGIHSVVYLESKDGEGPSPTALVTHVCEQTAATQQCRTRHCSRFYPIEHTCYASMEKIQELAEQVAQDHFPEDAEQPIEFAVVYDARAAPALDRMEVINAFAARIPKPHKVNLTAPHKTIVVNVVKAVCGVAVVERYKELCRFNIRTLALPEEEREAQREASRQQGKKPEAAQQQQQQQSDEQQTAQETEGAAGAGEERQEQQDAGAA